MVFPKISQSYVPLSKDGLRFMVMDHDWIDGYPPMIGKSTHVTGRNAHIPK